VRRSDRERARAPRASTARAAALISGALVLASVAALAIAPAAARAQSSGAVVNITLTDATDGHVLPWARLEIVGTNIVALSDSTGSAKLGVPLGAHTLVIRLVGYAPHEAPLLLESTEPYFLTIPLTAKPAQLAETVVEAKELVWHRRVPGLEERRKRNAGHFLTREDVEKQHPRRVTDLLRNVPGLQLVALPTGYQIRSHRAVGMRDCAPLLYINGVRMTDDPATEAPSASMILGDKTVGAMGTSFEVAPSGTMIDTIEPEAIEVVEVYTGYASAPVQFSTTDNTCGVILVWTKAGP
jgi:hypothetical protein